MAKIFASKLAQSCISETIKRLEDLQMHETASLSIVKTEVTDLKKQLKKILSLLPDAEKKQEEDYRVRTWIAQVIDAAHDIEDVVEIFISNLNFSNFITKSSPRHKFTTQFEYITGKLDDICKTQEIFQIQSSEEQNPDERISFRDLNAEEYDLVGLEADTETLKAQLISEEHDLSIVSIVGMGGVGKTTLAKTVYEKSDVKKHFDCCAWTCVSSQYQPIDILSDILLQVGWGKTIEETKDVPAMVSRLEQVLQGKRYLVVLDDIWEIDAWDSVKEAFPKGNKGKGSKIVFTTRIERVAKSTDLPSSTIPLLLLTDEDSFQLLRKKAFPRGHDGNYSCPPELELLGRKIIQKCRGLPLATVVLGGLLRMKKSDDERKKVLIDLESQLNKRDQEYEMLPILALSYNHLPYHLKPLFLYMSNFPEDSEIPKRKLIRLWLAEGFLTSREEGTTIEDAEQHLEGLIQRNMVQVGKRDHSGGVKTCRLHHLVRDFCISKARDENFCGVMKLQRQMNPMAAASSSTSTRRIGVYFGSQRDRGEAWVSEFHPHLRSLLCFDIPDLSLIPLSKEQFGLLRVLELRFVRGATKCKLSKKIGDLIHLRYLGLRAAGLSELPATIGNLRNLLTLDIRDNDGVILPGELSKLKRLMHLLMPLNAKASQVRIDKLTNIETLKSVEAADLIGNDAKSTLVHVRNLGVQFKKSEEAGVILESPIVKSGCLQSLTMSMPLNDSFPSLQPLRDGLRELDVTGKIQSNLQSLPRSLTTLVLERSEMKEDPMKVLESFANLKFLRLGSSSYTGTEMTCSAGGFRKLETLQLKGLFEVQVWQISESAMPSLKRLVIDCIPKLTSLPEGIKFVKTLQELKVSMGKSFVDRLKGGDFYKVENIASVTILCA